MALVTLSAVAGDALAQQLPLGWERVRREPIIERQGAAGIRLGDSEEAIIRKLGILPAKTSVSSDGLRKHLLFVASGPWYEWGIVIEVTLTFPQGAAEAIGILVGRRPPEAYQYEGRTTKGYGLGESKDRLRALYGEPDEIVTGPPGSDELWWYRATGLVVVPGEKTVMDQNEAKLIVVRPHLKPDELRHLILGP